MAIQAYSPVENRSYLPFFAAPFSESSLTNSFKPAQSTNSQLYPFQSMPLENTAMQEPWGIGQAIMELVGLVKFLVNELLGRESSQSFLRSNSGDYMMMPNTYSELPVAGNFSSGELGGFTRAAKTSSESSKGILGLLHSGADWVINKGYGWVNKKLGGSLDSLNSISVDTFGKLWDGGKKIATSVYDKVAEVGGSIISGVSNFGSSILS
ncbi:MAG: hypothetical protein KDD56_09400, partial [Bdellovibrionales bacterium]|nr:hypothetical protein [Bdellovibrionales bacterium]